MSIVPIVARLLKFFPHAAAAKLKVSLLDGSPLNSEAPRSILLIRRNRMGDVLSVLPLLKNLRRQFPQTRLVLACEPTGASVVSAFPYLDGHVVLSRQNKWLGRWLHLMMDAIRLQGFDAAIAVKGGFDFRLAVLTRWTNAPVRIGFSPPAKSRSRWPDELFYTHPVSLPSVEGVEHQVETQSRLLTPFSFSIEFYSPEEIEFRLPSSVQAFANDVRDGVPEIIIT